MAMKKNTVYILQAVSLIAAIVYMLIIFTLSSQNGTQSNIISNRLVEDIKQYLKISHVLQGNKMLENLDYNLILRKCIHFIEYFMLSIILYIVTRVYGARQRISTVLVIMLCLVYSCMDEYHQSFVLGRTPALRDVLIDISGSMAGLITICILKRTKSKRKSSGMRSRCLK